MKDAEYVEIVEVSVEEIDKINILNATKKAMQEVIERLEEKSDICIVDAVKDLKSKKENYQIISVIKGDDTSYTVACASIVAKVYRDSLMEKYEGEIPGYGFAKHKGYGTKIHYDAILEKEFKKIIQKRF